MQINVMKPTDIGHIIRQRRKEGKLTLLETAAVCNVNYRFLSELENGKATAQVGKVLQVLYGLGINVILKTRDDEE